MSFWGRIKHERWVFPGAANFWERIVYHPCARPWYVYVSAFVPAFAELALLVSIPFWDDLARMGGEHLVDEGGGRRGRRRRKRHGTKVRAIEKPIQRERYYAKGLNTLLVITQPLETIGFYWLLWAAGDRFFYRFANFIDQAKYCTRDTDTGPLSRRSFGGMVSKPAGAQAMPLPTLEQDRGGWGSTVFTASLPIGRFFCAFAITIIGPAGGSSDWRAELWVNDSIFTHVLADDFSTIQTGEEADFLIARDFLIPTIFGGTVQWRLNGPAIPIGIEIKRAHMVVWRHDDT